MEAFRLLLLWGGTFWFSIFQLAATHFQAGEKVTIRTTQSSDSYFAGGEIYIEAPIQGDLWVAGGELYLNDTIYNDLCAAGGELHINGIILDDVRAFGGEITLSGIVEGDVVLAGGKLLIEPNTIIRGNVIVSGGEIAMLGTIEGYFKAKAGELEIAGTVNGGTDLHVGNTLDIMGTLNGNHIWVARNILVNQVSRLSGNISYWHEGGEMDFEGVLVRGIAQFDPDLKGEYYDLNWQILGKYWIIGWLLRVLGALLLMILLRWGFPWIFREAGITLNQEYLRSMGKGFLFFIGIPVLLFLLFIMVIGIPIGVFGVFLYASILFFSHILTALILAETLTIRRGKPLDSKLIVLLALALYLGIKIVNWIPFIGWLISIVLTLAALGALISSIHTRRKRFLILAQN